MSPSDFHPPFRDGHPPESERWTCTECTFDNFGGEACDFCETPRSGGMVARARSSGCALGGSPGLAGLQAEEVPEGLRGIFEDLRSDGLSKDAAAEPAEEAAGASETSEADQAQAAADEACRWAEARLRQLRREIADMDGWDAGRRRQRLRALQLELHPDKQPPAQRSHAQPLFLLVQEEWETSERTMAARRRRRDEQRRREEEDEQEEEARRQEAARRRAAEEERARRVREQEEAERRRRSEEAAAEAEAPEDDGEALSLEEAASRYALRQEERRQKQEERRRRREDAERRRGPADLEPLSVHIGDITGRLCTILGNRSWAICDLKQEMEGQVTNRGRTRIPRERQRLLRDSRDLGDSELLGSVCGPAETFLELQLVHVLDKYCSYEWMATAVVRSWRALQYASSGLRAEREIVRLAMCSSWRALQLAAPELRLDRSLVKMAVLQDGLALEAAPPSLRGDRELAFLAVRRNWKAIEFCSEELRADKELVLTAVRQEAAALLHGCPDLLEDREVIMEAVKRKGAMLQYAPPKLKADRQIVLAALKQDGRSLAYAAQHLREDPGFFSQVVDGNPDALRYADFSLRDGAEGNLWDSAWDFTTLAPQDVEGQRAAQRAAAERGQREAQRRVFEGFPTL